MSDENNNSINHNPLTQAEKLDLLHAFTCSMGHELRTPLATANMALGSIKDELPVLLDAYEKAKKAGLCSSDVSVKSMDELDKICEGGLLSIRASFNVIDMLIVKAGISSLEKSDFTQQSILNCIENAIKGYPFHEDQREKINIDCQEDFIFFGHTVAMTHVLFNLIKNSLWHAADRKITIKTESAKDRNQLYFIDAGQGIAADVLPHIFEQFYSKTTHGAGIGLSFCKIVMESMGGSIACDSKKGEYTKFILSFPKDSWF